MTSQVADLMLESVIKRTNEQQDVVLEITDGLKERMMREGYSPEFGARPLRRTVQRLIEDVVAESVLDGFVERGGSLVLDDTAGTANGLNDAVVVRSGSSEKFVAVATTAGIEDRSGNRAARAAAAAAASGAGGAPQTEPSQFA